MSLETWIDEFYPDGCVAENELEAAELSLKKWKGLTQESMEKHGVKKLLLLDLILNNDDTGEKFVIDSNTCSLCYYANKYYYNERSIFVCQKCVLGRMFGKTGCIPMWIHWFKTGDANPMIAILDQAVSRLKTSE